MICRSPVFMYFVAIFALVMQIQVARSQNPFDIRSRTLIDSANLPETKPLEIDADRTLPDGLTESDGQQTIPVIQETNQAPKTGIDDLDTMYSAGSSESSPTDDLSSQNTLPDQGIFSEITPSSAQSTSINWWYYIFDLILLLFLLGAFLYDKNIFPPLSKAFLHENFLRFLYRDTYIRKPGVFLYLNIIFLLSMGFILFRIAQFYGQVSTLRDYLIIQGVVFLLFTIKHLALHFLSNLVDKPFEVKFYRYWMILSAGLIGLWMIPITLMVSVLPSQYLFLALLITTIPVILLLIYRQAKAIFQAKYFFFKHFFHFFLYFCAVEIVPVVLLADILVNY